MEIEVELGFEAMLSITVVNIKVIGNHRGFHLEVGGGGKRAKSRCQETSCTVGLNLTITLTKKLVDSRRDRKKQQS